MTGAAQTDGLFYSLARNPLGASAVLVRFAGVFALALLFVLPAPAQMQNESSVKAAFVYNLTKYVEWPQTITTLRIGVIGDGPMGATLQSQMAGKSSESRAIQVLLSPSEEALTRCSILYITYRSPKKIREVLGMIRNANVLTIGEADSFARDGGMISLVTVSDHVQLQVNLEATQGSHLKVSSRLLNLATLVRSTSGAKD
jgi:hypothetical protein